MIHHRRPSQRSTRPARKAITATQNRRETHATPPAGCPGGGLHTRTIDQRAPFQRSTAEAPTPPLGQTDLTLARQNIGDVHETSSGSSSGPVCDIPPGAGTIDQCLPFQRSANDALVDTAPDPTAIQK